MAEHVKTGGVMTFRYDHEQQPVLDGKLKKDIKDAYAQAAERKQREQRRKKLWFIIVIVAIILLFLMLAVLFF